MFAVNPRIQALGLDKKLLNYAENFAIKQFLFNQFVMVVLKQRTALIEFCQRRGYAVCTEEQEYPKHLNVGTPKIDLKIVTLTKKI